MKLKEKIEELGIPKNESEVYLTLIKSGGMNASEVAKVTGIHRSNIYDILKRLENKGLVGSFTLNGKTFYKARRTEGLKDFLEEKLGYVDVLSSELKRYKGKEKECNVSIYSGKKVIRVLQKDALKELEEKGGISRILGVDEKNFEKIDHVMVHQFFQKMKRKKFFERIIVGEGEKYFPGTKESSEYRTLPLRYFDSNTTYSVYGDKVAILLFSEPPYLILIDSKKVANSYRKSFDLLWDQAKEVKR